MSDDIQNPAEQDVSRPQQQVDWKARFDGQVRKIEELTLRNRELEGQLVTKTSEMEQLRTQLSIKDTEKSAIASEKDKAIQELVQGKTALETEAANLRALALKVKIAREMGRPDLIKVLDTIPNVTDEEALKGVLSTLSEYADAAVREREKQLLAGITPAVTPSTSSAPSSEKEWTDFINRQPLGSPERLKAHDDYWNWLVAKHK